MKVKVLSRNPDDYIRGSTSEINRVPRNLDPDLHPFEAAREYTRALNAAKLERVFAKPFVASLDGHTDGVNCVVRNPVHVTSIASGACDGQVMYTRKKIVPPPCELCSYSCSCRGVKIQI